MPSLTTTAPQTSDNTTATTMRSAPDFTATPGIIPNMGGRDPVDFFQLMFDDCLLDLIFTETTRYAEQYLERKKEHLESHPNARAHDIRNNKLTWMEVEAFDCNGDMWLPTLRYVCSA